MNEGSATGAILASSQTDIQSGYLTTIISAPKKTGLNLYDIDFWLEVSSDQLAWVRKNSIHESRDIAIADEPIHIVSVTRVENLEGAYVRSRLSVGQSVVSVTSILSEGLVVSL